MKSLFNEYEAFNKEGYLLDDVIYKLIKPVIMDWINLGFPINDIENIIVREVAILCAEKRLTKAIKMKKEERNEDNNN